MFQRILLAIDEDESGDEALRAVTALARAFSSEVTVFHVRERTVTSVATIEKESIPESFAFGRAVAARLTAAGVKAAAVVDTSEHDRLARLILERAEALHADLIVIGAHRHHSLRERLFGDMGRTLAHQTRCPVLLMPGQPDRADQ
jgi:nucleotide-binding universal stress UspA family protein